MKRVETNFLFFCRFSYRCSYSFARIMFINNVVCIMDVKGETTRKRIFLENWTFNIEIQSLTWISNCNWMLYFFLWEWIDEYGSGTRFHHTNPQTHISQPHRWTTGLETAGTPKSPGDDHVAYPLWHTLAKRVLGGKRKFDAGIVYSAISLVPTRNMAEDTLGTGDPYPRFQRCSLF